MRCTVHLILYRYILSLCIHCTHDCAARIWHYTLLLSFTVSNFFFFTVLMTLTQLHFVNSRYCISILCIGIQLLLKRLLLYPTYAYSCIYIMSVYVVQWLPKKCLGLKMYSNCRSQYLRPTTPTILCIFCTHVCRVVRTHG